MSFPRYEQYKDSGVEWLGTVPAHWEVRRLKQLLTEPLMYGANESGGDGVAGHPRYIRITDIDASGKLREETFKSLPPRVAEPYFLSEGDILLARSGATVGKSFIYRESWGACCFAGYLIRARADRHVTSPEYLRFSLQSASYWQYVSGAQIQATIQNVSAGKFGNYALSVPPVAEQTAIATFLRCETAKIDALVDEQQNLIALLKEKRQALITHAVTKGLDPAAPMKDSGVAWLGEVPAHWDVGPLKRFADVIDCKHYTVQFLDEGWPIASIRELRDDRLDLSDAKRTSRDEWDFLREGRVPKRGDLIFCRNASVGAVAYVDGDVDFCMGQDVCLIRPNFDGRFMHYQMTCAVVRNQIEAFLVGATIRRANVEEIRNLVVVWPNKNDQQLIAAYLQRETDKFDALIAEAENAIALLQERRTALISAAVTGKIDVRGLMRASAEMEAEAA